MIGFDWPTGLAFIAVAMAGVVRGYSGFGAAMIMVTSLATIFDPVTGVVALAMLDSPTSLLFARTLYRYTRWDAVAPIFAAALVTIPVGVWLLSIADQTLMRRSIAVTVLVFAAISAGGWQIKRTPGIAARLTVGLLSGGMTGAAGLGGPPVILYFLAQEFPKQELRASALTFLLLSGIVALVFYFSNDMISRERIDLVLVALPVYAVAMWQGGRIFQFVSETRFRQSVIVIVVAIAFVSFLK